MVKEQAQQKCLTLNYETGLYHETFGKKDPLLVNSNQDATPILPLFAGYLFNCFAPVYEGNRVISPGSKGNAFNDGVIRLFL